MSRVPRARSLPGFLGHERDRDERTARRRTGPRTGPYLSEPNDGGDCCCSDDVFMWATCGVLIGAHDGITLSDSDITIETASHMGIVGTAFSTDVGDCWGMLVVRLGTAQDTTSIYVYPTANWTSPIEGYFGYAVSPIPLGAGDSFSVQLFNSSDDETFVIAAIEFKAISCTAPPPVPG